MIRKIAALALSLICIFAFTACGSETESTSSEAQTSDDTIISGKIDVKYTARDISGEYDASEAQTIELSGEDVEITEEGTYILSGTLDDGQITVNTEDTEKVQLVLNGADISCSDGPAIYVENADKVFITLAEGTENSLSDGSSNSTDTNAAVYSKDNLTINGTGSLTVTGNFEDGIVSKDDLKICGGTVTVTAKDDGLRGNDSVRIYDGDITVSASGDGIKADNTEDEEKGFISIDGGKVNVKDVSSQGIDASNIVQITGGEISIESSNEGIEGKIIYVSGGESVIDVNDDCLNATSDDSSINSENAQEGVSLEITDGKLTLSASTGDALDSNGDLTVSGGTIILNGASSGVEVPMDYNGTGTITGGTICGTGSSESNMLQNFGDDSTQCSLLYSVSGQEGDEISLTDSDGNEIASFTAAKSYGSVLISSADIEKGETYTLKTGSSSNEVTFDSCITSVGNGAGGMGGGGDFGNAPGGHGEMQPTP